MLGQTVGADRPTHARFGLGILFALAFAATLWVIVTVAMSPAAHADTRGAGGSAHSSSGQPAASAARTTVTPTGTTTSARTALATSATSTSSQQTSPTSNRAPRSLLTGPELPALPQIQVSTEPTRIDPAVMTTLTTPSAATSAAASGASANNLGFGNVGQWNLGNGNAGDFNVGSGNAGDRNIGFGNLGSDNVGAGNSGDGNVGLGNTGNNNIGFGNTGNNCVGIGLTGDNQVGFGGWNSGTNNTGLFNSGSGNSGFFNSGTGNFGFANSGTVNTGLFNAGGFNTGWNNVGNANTGHANTGDANTGGFNSGNTNTGWANTGNANTGLANSGNVNTGAFISGNLSNGLFVTGDEQNWLPSVRYTTTLPGLTIDDTLPLVIDQTTTSAELTVIVGPTTADVHVTGTTAPIEVVLFETPSGPGFFNSTDSPSSGLFNSGSGGGSGLFNVGEGVSGLWNAAVAQFMDGTVLSGPALVSGLGNYGLLTSGVGNLGAGISGLANLSALDPWVVASLAGLGNVGAGFAGALWNSVSGLPSLNLGFGDVGSLNIGGGNVGDFNLGFGNVGSWNLGNGNLGDLNIGSGNSGDENVGFGNLGSKNVGAGNSGDGNVGLGNTGNNNIGFGNTGNNCVGIGLTGDNQVGFGGWNSGTNNTGLFNSGSGNSGFFNSGTGNFGFANSGTVNTGLFNAGGFNTGVNNVGSYNTGHANVGDANTGGFNVGNINTGWVNTGDANTGLANNGNLNTGALNLGNRNNGFLWRTNDNGQLNVDIGSTISEVAVTLTADIPVDIPVTGIVPLGQGPVTIYAGGPLPAITVPVNIDTRTQLQDGVTLDLAAQGALNLGSIVLPPISVVPDSNPLFTATIGDANTDVPIDLTGTIGPIRLSLLKWGGPGLFNSTDAPSSGLFNSGSGGGSGLFNVGEGVSGLWNAAVAQLLGGPALVSGLGNYGLLTSGVGNLGSGISGLLNLSSLDAGVSASLAGLGNVGAGFAGALWNSVTGLPALNLGFGDVGSLNIGGGNVGDFNLGFGNVGRWNLGNGNAGDRNVGFGNLGSDNVGAGNSGDGNVGLGNTGNNNIGFGNTGNNCVGIGLTGDNQVGFGGWNSGTNNTGLFNSGSGNSGFFNSGTLNTGLFNSGTYNTGWSNAGSYNTGNANTGYANTGGFNAGNTNTGWVNTGDANTGLANYGDLNTGALNLGNRNNGFLWRTNDNGQLNIGVGLTISEIPVDLAADVPVDIPVQATVGPDVLDVLGFTVPTIAGGLQLTPVTLIANIDKGNLVKIVAGPIVFNQNPDVTIDPIVVPNFTLTSTDPLLSGSIGSPDTSIPVRIGGSIGPTRISLLAFGGPGFFNSIVTPSSGFFNSSGGVDIGATVSSISANLGARIPLNIPVTAELGSVGTLGATIPGFSINTTNWTTIANQPFTATLDGQPLAHVFDFTVLSGLFAVSDITIPAVTVDLPAVTGSIGGSDTAIPINFSAESAPFRILPLLAGSGVGAGAGAGVGGGSGLFNSGAGLSGLLNQTALFGRLSGLLNQGVLGSGAGNAGAGNSGWVNTGTEQSGALGGWPGIGTLLGRVVDRLRPLEPPAVRGVTVTDLLLGYALDVPVDVPADATFTNPIEIPFVAIPTTSIGPLLGAPAFIEAAILNKARGANSNYPTNNPCGADADRGACVPFQLTPSFTIGGGAGPITISPGGILTPTGQQVFSTEIGGIGQGIRASGTVGAGPINILPGSPVTVEQFPYVYQGAVTTDIPVTTEVGAIISQFDAQDIIGGTMGFKYGYCYLSVRTQCNPDGLQTAALPVTPFTACSGNNAKPTCYVSYFVWGNPINQHQWRGYPKGPFPPNDVLNIGAVPLVDQSGTFVEGGRILNFVLNSGTPTTTSFGGSGTLGPFPRPGG